jgi:hypothetical protein
MFKLVKILNGRINVPEPEFLPAPSSVTVKEGMTLNVASGAFTKTTSKPTHIAMKTQTKASEELPAMRVDSNMVFEVATSSAGSIVVGSKLALGSDSLTVGAASDSGVATVVGTNKVDKIHVIFE